MESTKRVAVYSAYVSSKTKDAATSVKSAIVSYFKRFKRRYGLGFGIGEGLEKEDRKRLVGGAVWSTELVEAQKYADKPFT